MSWTARIQNPIHLCKPAMRAMKNGLVISAKAGVRAGINLLLPPRCVYCDADMLDPADAIFLCEECRNSLAPPTRARCRRCGSVVPQVEGLSPPEDCPRCRELRLRLDAAVALGCYENELRLAVLRMKRPTGRSLALAMGRLLAAQCRQQLADLAPTLIVPVPPHWFHYLQRGANSPDILARCLQPDLGVAVSQRAVVRCRNTLLQSGLSPNERFKNMRGAFRCRPNYVIEGARILLVDDVLTTGATCSAIAAVLKKGGAAWVGSAVLARAHGDV